LPKKRLKRNNLGGRIAGLETVDKMTDRQMAAKVRKYFQKYKSGAVMRTTVDMRKMSDQFSWM
jgi:hypothetical protein